jgi:hypothetical protein
MCAIDLLVISMYDFNNELIYSCLSVNIQQCISLHSSCNIDEQRTASNNLENMEVRSGRP